MACAAVLTTAGQLRAAPITYSGTGIVTLSGHGSDPWEFGPYPNQVPLEMSLTVDDREQTIRTDAQGDYIKLAPTDFVDGTLTIDGRTSPITDFRALCLYDGFESSTTPKTDYFSAYFHATFSGRTHSMSITYRLDPNSYSFSGATATPPNFGTAIVFQPTGGSGGSTQGHYTFNTGMNAGGPNPDIMTSSTASPAPEPSTLALVGIGSVCMLAAGARRRRRSRPREQSCGDGLPRRDNA